MSLLASQLHRPILCYVTDRRGLGASEPDSIAHLLERIRELAQAGVDWIQLREKDLSGRASAELVRKAEEIRGELRGLHEMRVLVNERLDVALAEGANGVHLAENSMPVTDTRSLAASSFLVGASVHSLERALQASAEGADYLFFGPVFATPSKAAFGPAQGLARLGEICRSVEVPVLAIGGITLENAAECLKVGAAGIAAIRLFQDAKNPRLLIGSLRGLGSQT